MLQILIGSLLKGVKCRCCPGCQNIGTILEFPKQILQTPASADSSKRAWFLWHQVTPTPAGELVEQPVGEPGRPAAHQVNSWEIRCPGKIGSLLLRQLAVRRTAQKAEALVSPTYFPLWFPSTLKKNKKKKKGVDTSSSEYVCIYMCICMFVYIHVIHIYAFYGL